MKRDTFSKLVQFLKKGGHTTRCHSIQLNDLVFLLFRLFGVAGATLGLAQWADGCVAVDLLMARQAALHGRRLLPIKNGKFKINIRYERDRRRKFGNHKNTKEEKIP